MGSVHTDKNYKNIMRTNIVVHTPTNALFINLVKSLKFTLKYTSTHCYLQMTILLFPTQKTTYKRQSIYYITYLKNIIWKLLQKRPKYLVSLEQIT